MEMSTSLYPVHVEAQIDPNLSRWQWLFKWLLAIPHFIVLVFLWMAFAVLSVIAFFAILFTGRYPRGIFDFNVGVLRWSWRVSYYAYGALGTDRYPPFSLEERADYPAHLEVDYPEQLSRGLVLVKWWLLAIPHYLIVGLFLGGVGWAANDAAGAEDGWRAGGFGLISLLVLFAAVVLLVNGRYPRAIFDLVLGLNRWVLRVAAYAALMTDVYPPFRLDQGGDDPTTLRTGFPSSTGPGATTWPADPEVPTPVAGRQSSPTTTPARSWTAGRIVALAAGSVVLLGSLGIGLAGGALAIADNGLRDDDGFLMSGTTELTTQTYAIATTSITLDADVPSAFMPEDLLGDVKVTATSDGAPVFVGIAKTSDVDAYLGGVEHATLTELADNPVYEINGTTAPRTVPADSDIWVAQTTGTGTQQVVWEARTGEWTLVVMNADGGRGITTDAAAGATVPALDWLVPTLLVVAAVGLAGAIVLLVVALRATETTGRDRVR
jgi:hypothetical protein